MSNLIAGFASITVNGASYRLAGQCEYKVSVESREVLKGQDAVHGYKGMPDVGFITMQGRDSNDLSVFAMNELDGVTVVASLANSKTIIATNAWRDGEGSEVNTEDGTFTIKFVSASVTEA